MAFVAAMAFIALVFPLVIAALVAQEIHIFSQITTYIDAIVFYMGQGMNIVWLFIPKTISIVCMSFTITLNVMKYAYKFLMWIFRKIPFLHIT